MNDDVRPKVEDWVEAMLEFAQLPKVGAVGAKLYFPDGSLQHVGVTILRGNPDHPYYRAPGETEGYGLSAKVVRNWSAVTGACMMSSREVFAKVGGFDESFALNYNDVDVASYHPRKNHRKLIESFVDAFGPSNRDVRLTIHSNLVFGGEYDDLGRLLQARGIENVELSRRCLTEADLLSLMNGFDVFVSASRGEGFAIPVRLAQMMNKLIVAVRTGAVAELDPLNVIWVAAGIRRAALYPEVNDSVYGHQFDAFKMDLRAALAIAADLAAARRGKTLDTARAEALISDNDALAQKYRVLCVPNAVAKGVANRIFADRLEVMDDALLARLRQRPSEHRSRDRSATATQPWQPRSPRR